MSDDFNLAHAEYALASALAARNGAERLLHFTPTVEALDWTIKRARQLEKNNAAMLGDAVTQLSTFILTDLAREVARCTTVIDAVEAFLEKHFHCPRGDDGKHHWEVRDNSVLTEPVEHLKRVMREVRSQQ